MERVCADLRPLTVYGIRYLLPIHPPPPLSTLVFLPSEDFTVVVIVVPSVVVALILLVLVVILVACYWFCKRDKTYYPQVSPWCTASD